MAERVIQRSMSTDGIGSGKMAVEKTALEMDLRALREISGKTQAELAALIEMTQSELSRFERREDHRLSMIRRYINALGGKLKVIAELNGRSITLVDR